MTYSNKVIHIGSSCSCRANDYSKSKNTKVNSLRKIVHSQRFDLW